MSNLFWLTEAQMDRLRPFFPKSHGRPRVDDRRVLSGIMSYSPTLGQISGWFKLLPAPADRFQCG
jgi:hypothetical protein